MNCPFRRRMRLPSNLQGVDPEFLDYAVERETAAIENFNERYPTCWAAFLAWLGVRK